MNKKAVVILSSLIVSSAAVFLMSASLNPDGAHVAPVPKPTQSAAPTEPPVKVTVFEPTCSAAGYTLYEDVQTGTIRIEDGSPALGHTFTESASLRTCSVCGYEEPVIVRDELARIDLTGSMDKISKDQRVVLKFDFANSERQFSCYSSTSWQGHSSLPNPKKNYMARLFFDESLTEKHRLIFNNWQLEHKYALKANYTDATQSRNLICARVWGQMASTRPSIHERLKSTSNYGATDGFPVAVWHNGAFHGLFTMMLHKDDDLYGMYKGSRDAIMICNSQSSDESLFRKEAAFIEDQSDWEVEFSAEDQVSWAQQHFNSLICFIMESDDATFSSQLDRYLDVDAAIDYLLFMYAMGLTDNAAKDLVMLTYDGGPWIPTVYDMEDAFGLSVDGSFASEANVFLPVKVDGVWSSSTGSLLWDRLLQHYEARVIKRWTHLRQSTFSQETLTAQANALLHAIPAQMIDSDLKLYPDRVLIENPNQQIISYIEQRLPLLDTVFFDSAR